MSKALKWIDEKKEYIPYDLPNGACLYTDNMEQEIACCQCGKKVKFGDCYTSRTIHTELGLGYAECEDCYCKDLGSDSWKNTQPFPLRLISRRQGGTRGAGDKMLGSAYPPFPPFTALCGGF